MRNETYEEIQARNDYLTRRIDSLAAPVTDYRVETMQYDPNYVVIYFTVGRSEIIEVMHRKAYSTSDDDNYVTTVSWSAIGQVGLHGRNEPRA